MSDAAAVGMGEWFLSEPANRSVAYLAEILQHDPPLALWVAAKADLLGSSPPHGISDLAVLLAERGLAWLQWEGSDSVDQRDAQREEEIANRAATVVLASKLAAELAATHSERVRSEAQLLALLHDPRQWLALADIEDCPDPGTQSPHWLAAQSFDPAAVAAAAEAIQSANRRSEGEGCASDYAHRRQEVAAQWIAAHRAARWLPALTARLAKLANLERSFLDAVETEKLAALAEFAAGAGHEINNPLAVIAGRAQLLLRDEADPERRRDLALVNAQAMRVHEMIADLRLFANPPELERQPVDLTLLVRRLIGDLQPIAREQETALCLTDAPAAIRLNADPVQLIVALRALCQNALQAVGHRGRVEVAVVSDGGEASISVADDGPGIPPEHRPHIFEPFYSARQAGRGVGMGLSKCWRIVTLHGGRIEVVCTGFGTRFEIRLPLL
jgi:signal transduction histidine kinase